MISRSLVAHLAPIAPEAALWLRPDDPEALLSLAERHVDPAKPIDEAVLATAEEIRTWAETALINDPINARAYRILGQLAHAAGDAERATSYMQAAARRWVHDGVAVSWLLQNNFEKKNYAAAVRFADVLLRTHSRAMPNVLPILGRIAETPEARGELETLLAGNPPWRRAFLSALPTAVSDARTPLRILLAIKETPSPPGLADIRTYLDVLIAHKFHELAYYTWLQFLPPEQLGGAGLLFNGSFEWALSGMPFDWTIGQGTGAIVDIVPRTDAADQRALLIELGPGRVEFGGVAQTLLLAPGTYQFKGRYKGEVSGRRGLMWRVVCAGGTGAVIGQSAMMVGVTVHWKEVEFQLTVPQEECRAQQLRLVLDARMPSEQLVSGSVWYDELAISRVE